MYSSNNKAINLLTVSIYSLIKSKHKHTIYKITIAHYDFKKKQKNRILEILKIFQDNNVSIRFVNCKNYDIKYQLHKISNSRNNPLHIFWPSPMYYYFFVKLFYKTEHKIIYLDTDTIIYKDLTPLYDYQFNTTFAGVKEYTLINWFNEQNNLYKSNKLPKSYYVYKTFLTRSTNRFQNYLNSGVLLINMDKYRQYSASKILNKAIKKHLPDQDIIGLFFEKNITNINLTWNYCIHYFMDYWYDKMRKDMHYDIDYAHNWKQNASILHFTVRPKPSYFYNRHIIPIIHKLKGIEKYNQTLLEPKLAHQLVSLDADFFILHKVFHSKIIPLSKITSLYPEVFFEYGRIWYSMYNDLLSIKND